MGTWMNCIELYIDRHARKNTPVNEKGEEDIYFPNKLRSFNFRPEYKRVIHLVVRQFNFSI